MITMTLNEAAKLLQTAAQTDTAFQGISLDTRTLQPGNLFVAIKGNQQDGHDYLHEAALKGAAAALVSRETEVDLPQLIVSDTTLALGQLAAGWRERFSLPIVAITGSNGKTTTKNILASILRAACHGDETRVLATKGTLNNQWGLPLTLARLNAQHRYAVIEMGMNHFGEIAYLTRLTQPGTAVITNAGPSHLEGVGNLAGVAKAKAEIFSGLTTNGTAILNRDDVFYPDWLSQIGTHPHLTFGFHAEAQVRATIHAADTTQRITLMTPKGSIEINFPLLGKHNIANALAATAAALAISIDLTAIKCGLEAVEPVAGRLQLHVLSNGVKLIDDSYNANPLSVDAALEALSHFAGKKIFVLGDMRELGEEETLLHQQTGEKIRAAGVDYLFTYGDLSEHSAHAFGEGSYHFTEQEKLISALKPFLYNQTTILIKGSRSMKMEKVLTGLTQ